MSVLSLVRDVFGGGAEQVVASEGRRLLRVHRLAFCSEMCLELDAGPDDSRFAWCEYSQAPRVVAELPAGVDSSWGYVLPERFQV